jgi:hypothetical protein
VHCTDAVERLHDLGRPRVKSSEERLRQCDGWITRLRGHTVAYTGSVLVDGTWVPQAMCGELAQQRGADWRDDWSSEVTLLVHGALAGKRVVDPARGYSRKLVGAQQSRQQRRHVHVVDADGFSDLLAGTPAPCRQLRRRAGHITVAGKVGDGILGGPLRPRRIPRRSSGDVLKVDWDQIDAATAAHEETIRALIAHLRQDDVEVRGPWRGGPRFDAGWTRGRTVYIAEVKSLLGAHQDQQIRLGLGQLLDYEYRIPKALGHVVPVLVLERRPASDHWAGLCASHGARLTWAPDFLGL